MRYYYLLTALFFFTICSAQKQTGSVIVKILTENNPPLEGATVQLLQKKDSMLVRSALSDNTGMAELSNIVAGDYIIKITAIKCNFSRP